MRIRCRRVCKKCQKNTHRMRIFWHFLQTPRSAKQAHLKMRKLFNPWLIGCASWLLGLIHIVMAFDFSVRYPVYDRISTSTFCISYPDNPFFTMAFSLDQMNVPSIFSSKFYRQVSLNIQDSVEYPLCHP